MNGSEAPPSQAFQPTAGAPAPVTSPTELPLIITQRLGGRPNVFLVTFNGMELGRLSFGLRQHGAIKIMFARSNQIASVFSQHTVTIGSQKSIVPDEQVSLQTAQIVAALNKRTFTAPAPTPGSSSDDNAIPEIIQRRAIKKLIKKIIRTMKDVAAEIKKQPFSQEEKVPEQAQPSAAETRGTKRTRSPESTAADPEISPGASFLSFPRFLHTAQLPPPSLYPPASVPFLYANAPSSVGMQLPPSSLLPTPTGRQLPRPSFYTPSRVPFLYGYYALPVVPPPTDSRAAPSIGLVAPFLRMFPTANEQQSSQPVVAPSHIASV